MSNPAFSNEAIKRLEVMSVDLPFRLTFKHAAAARTASGSIFIRCTTESGAVGFGESLPREYVSGESQKSTHELLRDELLPRLIGKSFGDYGQLRQFLLQCNGKAPADWGCGNVPQTAAYWEKILIFTTVINLFVFFRVANDRVCVELTLIWGAA